MRIHRLSLREGSENARGTVVVIDVFRAFTCEPLMYYYGANTIILEPDIDRCLAFGGNPVRVGELNERPIEGFDLTNSPWLIMQKGRELFDGRTVIHRTTSGVTGAAEALKHGSEVLLASFANARATAEYITRRRPGEVSIVAMGIRSEAPAPEDEFCGDYIESLLAESEYDHLRATAAILAHETARKFLRGDSDWLPREDPAICLQRDLFGYALRAQRRDGRIVAECVGPE